MSSPAPRRPWALPAVPLYGAALRAKDALRAAGILRTRSLQWPVVSVGSLSAGGAGKTPAVIALATLLQKHGHAVDVLSRGYRRQGRGVERVNLSLPGPARRFGDEPVLIAAATGAPVWVAANRHAAGLAAEQDNPSPCIHLLDDGFQHRRLARSFDIVVLTAEDLHDALLPAGNRREPLSALRRAHAIILLEQELDRTAPLLRPHLAPGTHIWPIRRSLHLPGPASQYEFLAFSGIARPQGFVDMLSSCGLRVIDSVSFPDHHRYTGRDMRRLAGRLRSRNATAFIATEKDAVKITPGLRSKLERARPLLVAQLRTEFADPARVLADLEARCR